MIMTIEKKTSLDARLKAVFDLVREGSVICDVGSDHGYLPIALLKAGKCPFAVVSDLNEGPLNSAKANLNRAKLSDKAQFYLTDGLTGIPLEDRQTDIAVCGMGGELISEILSAAPQIKNEKYRLVLQPMTHTDKLRGYLWENGFEILGECHAKEGDKLYAVFSVVYTGMTVSYTETEREIGKRPDGEFVSKQLEGYYLKILETERKIIKGKSVANKVSPKEKALFEELEKTVKERIRLINECK